MKTKSALSSATIIGILTTIAGTFGVPAVSEDATTTQLVLQIVGTLLALWGRWRQGDLTVLPSKTTVPPAALLLLGVGTFSGCAAPASEQGRASQGGSTGQQPVVNVTVTFGGQVRVDGLSSGTAAPSAASEAQNRQDAKQDTSVPIDASGLVPAAGAGKVLGGLKAPKVPVAVPVEIVVPAPVPAPAPTVPETPAPVDAPVPPPLAPIGG